MDDEPLNIPIDDCPPELRAEVEKGNKLITEFCRHLLRMRCNGWTNNRMMVEDERFKITIERVPVTWNSEEEAPEA
jgi:hypothetical protein